ncbi:hypothetical protein [Streptomyces nitrosporeus]|uniref:hypothetical protein n=1 Tax=Streptomyces nitrosporeus TaxID=28894 RepID=UPI00332E197E
MEMIVTVCNVCKTPGLPTARYWVQREGEARKKLDLCETDAAPLEDALTHAETPAAQEAAPRSPRARRRKVTTLEEIEKIKAAEAAKNT